MGLAVACSKQQDKIGWEPEVAAPLAHFVVDFNDQSFGEKKLQDFAKTYFDNPSLTQNQQNEILYSAISQGLDDSIKKLLPRYLQEQVDTFVYRKEHAFSIPSFMASVLMMDLFDHFEQNNSVVAINKFSYYVITGLPAALQEAVKDSLYHLSVNVRQNIGLNLTELRENTEDMHWLKLQLAISTRLAASARLQVYLINASGARYDSLFQIKNGRHEGQMPFAANVMGEYKQRVVCDYPTPDLAQNVFGQLHTLSLVITSDSLCMDTSLVWLKDLYNRKLNTTVGIMFKSNLDDLIEE